MMHKLIDTIGDAGKVLAPFLIIMALLGALDAHDSTVEKNVRTGCLLEPTSCPAR